MVAKIFEIPGNSFAAKMLTIVCHVKNELFDLTRHFGPAIFAAMLAAIIFLGD